MLLCILSFLMSSFILMYSWVHLLLHQCSTCPPHPHSYFLLNTYCVVRDVLSFLGQKGSLPQGAFLPAGVADPSPIAHNPRPLGPSHLGKPWMMPVLPHLCEELLGTQSHCEVQ